MESGISKLLQWSTDFKPSDLRPTSAHVWVKFKGLNTVCWKPKILFDIGECIGTPIKIDQVILAKQFVHYASVLIDMELVDGNPPSSILITRKDFSFK